MIHATRLNITMTGIYYINGSLYHQ